MLLSLSLVFDKAELLHQSKEFKELQQALEQLYPATTALDLQPKHLFGIELSSLSVSQLAALEEIHLTLLRRISKAKVHFSFWLFLYLCLYLFHKKLMFNPNKSSLTQYSVCCLSLVGVCATIRTNATRRTFSSRTRTPIEMHCPTLEMILFNIFDKKVSLYLLQNSY